MSAIFTRISYCNLQAEFASRPKLTDQDVSAIYDTIQDIYLYQIEEGKVLGLQENLDSWNQYVSQLSNLNEKIRGMVLDYLQEKKPYESFATLSKACVHAFTAEAKEITRQALVYKNETSKLYSNLERTQEALQSSTLTDFVHNINKTRVEEYMGTAHALAYVSNLFGQAVEEGVRKFCHKDPLMEKACQKGKDLIAKAVEKVTGTDGVQKIIESHHGAKHRFAVELETQHNIPYSQGEQYFNESSQILVETAISVAGIAGKSSFIAAKNAVKANAFKLTIPLSVTNGVPLSSAEHHAYLALKEKIKDANRSQFVSNLSSTQSAVILPPSFPKLNKGHKRTLDAIFEKKNKSEVYWRDMDALIIHLGGKVKNRGGSKFSYELNGAKYFDHNEKSCRKDIEAGRLKKIKDFLIDHGIKKE